MTDAMEQAQQQESYLSSDALAVLIEVFQTEEGSARAYLLILIECAEGLDEV